MAVTYVENILGFKVPKLYTVHIPREKCSRKQLYAWCNINCKGAFYIIPSWCENAGCQFEDDNDATMFALRWS